MAIEPLYVLGAGGHAKVVLDAVSLADDRVVRVCDDDLARIGGLVLGHLIHRRSAEEVGRGCAFHVAIGQAAARRSLHLEMIATGARAETIVHPSASFAISALVAEGSFIAAHAVVGPGAGIGSAVIVNHGAVVDHDCIVGDFSHIAPNATLGGAVVVGASVLIGAGATVLPGVRIGDGAIIAAGSTIIQDVPSGDKVIFALTRKR